MKVSVFFVALLAAILLFPLGAGADEGVPAVDRDMRLALAEKMQRLRPARDQVETAIERYVSGLPEPQREEYRTGLKNILNYEALEKVSINAYAETFTVEELQAMVDYYSKPEARSASEKFEDYAAKVYPEIIRMLDRAMIRAKTGANPQ